MFAVIAESAISPGVVFAIIVILALIVLAVSIWLFRKNLQFHRSALPRERVAKRCPYCNAVMEPGASFCPNCGRQIPQVTTVTDSL